MQQKNHTIVNAGLNMLALGGLLFGVTSALAVLPEGACAKNQPCTTSIWQKHNALYFRWRGEKNFSQYKVRWNQEGATEEQAEERGGFHGQFKIQNPKRGTTYFFKVQGCNNKGGKQKEKCTKWDERRVVAN